MRILVVILSMMCCAAFAPAARADGDRFAVLPTLSSGGVTALAGDLTSALRRALQERSLVTVPGKAIDDAAVLALECQASRGKACAFDVGKTTDATKVIATELWYFAPSKSYEVSLAVADLRAQTFPNDWVKIKADSEESVIRQTRLKMLEMLLPGAMNGKLNIVTALVGAQIIVDGVAVGITPMLGPPSVSPGRHEVQVRYADAQPWTGAVTVEPEGTTNLRWCLQGNAVSDACDDSQPAGSSLKQPRLVGGLGAVGLGAVGLVAGGLSSASGAAAESDYAESESQADYDAITTLRTLSLIGFGAGGVLLVAGGAAAAASVMME